MLNAMSLEDGVGKTDQDSTSNALTSLCEDSDTPQNRTPKTGDVNSLAQCLVRHDTNTFFIKHCEEIYRSWVSLLHRTAVPPNIKHTDKRIIAAFEAIDCTLLHDTYILARLAYVQLIRMLTSVQKIVKNDRELGQMEPKVGRSNATNAIDIYFSIQRPGMTRRQLHQRIGSARRWTDLGGTSPFLLIAHSDIAEKIM